MAVVEVQAARTEDLGREVELLPPVADDRATEEAPGPGVHLAGDLWPRPPGRVGRWRTASLRLRWLSSDIVSTWPSASSPSNIQPSAPGEQGVGDVAQAVLDGRVGPRRRARALDPLAPQVGRDLRALEVAVAGVLNTNARAGDGAGGIQESDGLLLCKALGAALHPLVHQLKPTVVERSQHPNGSESGLRIDIRVLT